ncbi:MAG: bifunctional 2-C-methyl-D-erythritol 4-phosphate cytidylyltransferase/2-C-methyl-D-erythritol 2,4-cyclodiphosphate synthase [Pseudorhodoplanes sp.]|nr:bifunctional 2-C-methyl-D-erythritol 4-phosphate cytidylyltransferase/2-C-methyl-D-erythritol 2,4-cyclodiphosphate synthase [Pseudorhodoplanes sp.]
MPSSVAALVLAAGRGLRSGPGIPKQYRDLEQTSAVRASLGLFLGHPDVGRVLPVIHPDDVDLFEIASHGFQLPKAVFGGATRQASVLAGLSALEANTPDLVLVHDAARPFATPALIDRAIAAGRASGAAVPALPINDTVKEVDAAGRIMRTINRATLRTVQTPQAFDFKALLAAHRRAEKAGLMDFSDDAALAEWAGMSVTVFEGESTNMKLTTSEDFVRAQALANQTEVRTAMGFDVHAFGSGDHIMLGGVCIPFDRGLSGHSDADVGLHALVDALLGTLAEGDIGTHFPPSDPKWKGASSDLFLEFAVERVRARGGTIAHLDLTIVCEAPKIGPHRDAIRARIAGIAAIDVSRVAVKATTSEGLGFTGRGEGIVAYATATVRLPLEPSQ